MKIIPERKDNFIMHQRVAVLAALFCIFAWFLPSNTPIFASELELQGSSFPLGNRFTNRAWTPLRSALLNHSDKPTEATVVFTLSLQGEVGRQVSFSRTVWLPAHSRREAVMTVFLDLERDEVLRCFEGRNGQPNLREETITYADGSKVVQSAPRAGKPFQMQVELLRGGGGGAKVSQTELFSSASHPEGLNVFALNQIPLPGEREITYQLDGHEYIFGESETASHASGEGASVLANENFPAPEQLDGYFVQRGMVNVSELPRKWAAYQGMHTLIIGSPRGRDGTLGLDPQQQSSLLEWIWSGGRVVLMPGADPAIYEHPFFARLLPARVIGSRRIHAVPVMADYFDTPFPVAQDDSVRRAEILSGEGEVWLKGSDYVMQARRQVGHGEVWLSALHGSDMKTWSAGPDFFARMLLPDPSPVPGLETDFAAHVPDLMQQVVGIEAPDRTFVIMLLLGYCLAITLVLVYLRQAGRAEIGWPIVILLSIASLFLALRQGELAGEKTGLVQGEMGVTVLGNRKGVASANGFVSVYSPRGFTTDAVFRNPQTLATAFSGGAGNDAGAQAFLSSLNVREAEHFTLQGLKVNERELFTCRTMTLASYDEGVAFDFGYNTRGFTGKVVNRTGITLNDCIVVANRAVLQIGKLAPDESFDLSSAPIADDGKLSSSDFGGSETAATHAHILALLRRPDMTHGNNRQNLRFSWPVTFYGWANRPEALVSFGEDREPKQRAVQLLALPTEDAHVAEGENIHLPLGVCGYFFEGYSGGRVYGVERPQKPLRRQHTSSPKTPGNRRMPPPQVGPKPKKVDPYQPIGWKDVSGPVKFECSFLRPAGTENVDFNKALLHLDVNARNQKVGVEVLDIAATAKSGKDIWLPLKMPEGTNVIEITQPQKCIGTGENVLTVRISVRPEPGEIGTEGMAGLKWQIRTLDLELDGKVKKTVKRNSP